MKFFCHSRIFNKFKPPSFTDCNTEIFSVSKMIEERVGGREAGRETLSWQDPARKEVTVSRNRMQPATSQDSRMYYDFKSDRITVETPKLGDMPKYCIMVWAPSFDRLELANWIHLSSNLINLRAQNWARTRACDSTSQASACSIHLHTLNPTIQCLGQFTSLYYE